MVLKYHVSLYRYISDPFLYRYRNNNGKYKREVHDLWPAVTKSLIPYMSTPFYITTNIHSQTTTTCRDYVQSSFTTLSFHCL